MFFTKKIFRKDFIKYSLKIIFTGLLSYLFSPVKKLFAYRNYNNYNADNKTVYVVRGADLRKRTIENMVKKGFAGIGGINRYIKRGMKVVIKPNIGFNSKPEMAHTTNPYLVEAVAKMCIEAGAKVKIFDRTVHTPQLCYRRSGILKAAKNAGAEIEYIDNRKFRTVTVRNPLSQRTLRVYKDIIEADFIINMPIAKDHSSSTLTMSMKNLMGVLGGRRGWFHLSLHKSIVDFNKAMPVNLVILDALRILTDHGPGSGTPDDVKETKTIVFGTNPVTVDAYTTGLFNIPPERIEYLKLAAREGMGEIRRNKMIIKTVSV